MAEAGVIILTRVQVYIVLVAISWFMFVITRWFEKRNAKKDNIIDADS